MANILFSDEAQFTNTGYLNRYNVYDCKMKIIIGCTQFLFVDFSSLNILYRIIDDFVIRPYFFNDTVNI